jgi:general secretion pathway protein G
MNAKRYELLKKLRNQKGMSLIEILIVITLIAVAGSFVAGRVFDSLQEGNVKAARTQINGLKAILDDYRRFCNGYPTTDQNLDALVAKPTTPPECANYPASAFIQDGRVPKDPWGNPYNYESDGKKYVITSYGQDGKPDGEGHDKDIKSNDPT